MEKMGLAGGEGRMGCWVVAVLGLLKGGLHQRAERRWGVGRPRVGGRRGSRGGLQLQRAQAEGRIQLQSVLGLSVVWSTCALMQAQGARGLRCARGWAAGEAMQGAIRKDRREG